MIDYDDTEVSYRLQEVDYVVRQMQSDWEEITVESVARGVHNLYGEQGTPPSDELHEICEYYLQRYSNPFDGLGDVPSDLKVLTESGKSALLKAVTNKSSLLKSHAKTLDAYLEQMQQGSSANT
jgi:proline dehydrogenase